MALTSTKPAEYNHNEPCVFCLCVQVEALGGAHSPSLHAECTHLVTTSTDSDKFRFAQRNAIICVTPRWLADSVAAGWCQDERAYEVTPGGTLHKQPLRRETSAQMTEDAAAALGLPRPSGTALDASAGGLTHADASQLRSTTEGGGGGGGGQRGTSRLAREGHAQSTSVGATGNGNGNAAVPGAQAPALPAWDDLNCDDDAPLFLDACQVWVVGCTAAEAFEALRLCRQGGAKRFIDPSPGSITHVVVGSQLGTAEDQALAKYCADNRQAAVVGLEWLRRSCARREALPADERFAVTPATLAEARRRDPGAVLATGGSASFDAALGASAAAAAGLDPGAGSGTSLLARQQSGAPPGFLDSCYFTLAAVRGTPEAAAAERLIRAHGGRTFNASLPTRAATGSARAFAICPPSLPPTAAAAVRAAHPDFGAVPESGRFTLYWLQCCVEAGKVLPPQRGSPCYTPLPYPLPLPGMERVS